MMATSAPARALNGVQPDPDLWFDDGNVVVIAQQTGFRVHRGPLSRHSEMFRDMFSVPQPANCESQALFEEMDGCPVVHVTDTSYDFKHLLRAIYDGASVFPGVEPMEFDVLGSLVRMGHKYQIDTILQEALRRLETIFTNDFDAWDLHQGRSATLVSLHPEHAIEAVNLAQLTGRTAMLPSAFYMCGLLEVDTIMNGVTRADGTAERLSTHDLQRCIMGKMVLIKHDAEIMAKFFQAGAPEDCTCPSQDVRRVLMQSRHAEMTPEFPDLLDSCPIDPDYLLGVIVELELNGLCEPCGMALRAHLTAWRRDLWELLPGCFRLAESGWVEG
ncbi:hypothetical protein L227DRAFT_332951 [Lentinus tigrinus ALCF2SS1-6]|uniref:BTB domain-containing protein n=1 Tax=Lentinus tigrinus ALCF2SS1-6 TaxID=1328759 RepID=A0A5C2RWB4_9APHY|nr:hypothetical protein L227DRAFT_332951 [Lentinus tigrinus ALCF2SS1-6]